jgi:hypothetical protein
VAMARISVFNASLIDERFTPFSVCTLYASNALLARSDFKSTLPTISPFIMNGNT